MTEPRRPAPLPPAQRDGDLGVAAFLEARARADDARLRTAFAAVDERVRAEVRPPGARETLERAGRVRAGRRGGALLAAAAAAVVATAGGWVLLGPGGSGPAASPGPVVTASSAAPAPRTSTAPEPSRRPERTSEAPAPTASATEPAATSRPSRRRTTTAAAGGSPTTTAATPAGPRTAVTLFLLADDGSGCADTVSVVREIRGTGDPASVLRALLAGATDAERAAGYTSVFGPDVQATVSDDGRTVDVLDTAAFDDVEAVCRDDVVSDPIEQTAAALDVDVEILLRGSRLEYLLWD